VHRLAGILLLLGSVACARELPLNFEPGDAGLLDAAAADATRGPSDSGAPDVVAAAGADAGVPDAAVLDGGAPRFAPNDVSILFPLPARDAERARRLWLVPRAGEEGPYFPLDAPDTLPDLNADVGRALGYPASMITALRYDPCFPSLRAQPCQAQLRLVAQPVLTSADSVSMLDDAAAHLFYALSSTEARAVEGELAVLKARSTVSTEGPLSVHPGILADASGQLEAAVRGLVVAHCREDNLVRITVNSFAMDHWIFSRFDRAAGRLERQALTHLVQASEAQAWRREAFINDLQDPSGTIDPAPELGFTALLRADRFQNGAPVDPIAAQVAAERLVGIENPDRSSTDDVDCVSCHLATQTRLYAARNGVRFTGLAQSFQAPAGQPTELLLVPELRGNLGATINFGWHSQHDGLGLQIRVPSISQRTVNESAAVADYLGRR